MANRPRQNRAEQDKPPNMELIKPAEGDIHSAVGRSVTKQTHEAQPGPQAGQNPRT